MKTKPYNWIIFVIAGYTNIKNGNDGLIDDWLIKSELTLSNHMQ